jgi:hypothetical protein
MRTRAESIAAVRAALGLSNVLPSAWSYDQRTEYNKALAAYILANETVTEAARPFIAHVAASEPGPLVDYSFDWSQFGTEFAANAQELNPVPSWVSSTKWLLPVLAVLALAFFFAPQIGAGAGNYAAARVRSPRK